MVLLSKYAHVVNFHRIINLNKQIITIIKNACKAWKNLKRSVPDFIVLYQFSSLVLTMYYGYIRHFYWGSLGGRAQRTSLYYFCNSSKSNYLEIKNYNKNISKVMILKVQWVLVSPMGLVSSTDLPRGALYCTYLIDLRMRSGWYILVI